LLVAPEALSFNIVSKGAENGGGTTTDNYEDSNEGSDENELDDGNESDALSDDSVENLLNLSLTIHGIFTMKNMFFYF
jgi:hypothetical protein